MSYCRLRSFPNHVVISKPYHYTTFLHHATTLPKPTSMSLHYLHEFLWWSKLEDLTGVTTHETVVLRIVRDTSAGAEAQGDKGEENVKEAVEDRLLALAPQTQALLAESLAALSVLSKHIRASQLLFCGNRALVEGVSPNINGSNNGRYFSGVSICTFVIEKQVN